MIFCGNDVHTYPKDNMQTSITDDMISGFTVHVVRDKVNRFNTN